MARAPDQLERDRALAAVDNTVLIDAGAGTGKTTLLVERMLTLLAPSDDRARAIPLQRIAAVTFTRRAAGELRLRSRERILKELAKTELSDVRRRRLLDALGNIDGAFIGTIHSFADRMLRLQPMKARLSPAYEITEDIDALVDETFNLLLYSIQNGTLAAELRDETPEYASEVERTFQEALRAGVLVQSYERDPLPPKVGLDLLVRGFIEHRDREITHAAPTAFDRRAFDVAASEFLSRLSILGNASVGARWLGRLGARIRELPRDDPMTLYELVNRIKTGRKRFRKTKHFDKGIERDVWQEFVDKDGLADRLAAPLSAAMARRLAHTRHAVMRLYDEVKTRHSMLDSIDLLMSLRNLLRDDLDARAFYQTLFDHVLVDELQDTDPLQTEIILYIAEEKSVATRWQDVRVGKGRLTLVGDPKQSIYRFRRADVGMYEQLREQVRAGEHVSVTLSANFRSTVPLIDWANDRFAEVLGTSATHHFDPATGQVFHQPQVAGRHAVADVAVHKLPYGAEEMNAPLARSLEGKAIAAYVRRLVERTQTKVRDADTHGIRPVRFDDVAVLALVTTNLRRLFDAFDGEGVPYSMSGGVLFATDPLHQQFLLGLRALGDRSDGVAEAALLRPPFFAIDLLDLIRDKAKAGDAAAERAAKARDWVRETRRRRFEHSPGHTARALLEQTGFGRAVALGANGVQRLRHLHELCLQLELHAAKEGLDYDGATARLRDWIDHPPKVEPPHPIASDAVQVMTVHQAKGLEFPIVVLWDSMGLWRAYESMPPWRVDRNGAGWSMKTNDVEWEEPVGGGMLERERQFANAEKRRLVYVAATRARDLLVIPNGSWNTDKEKYVHAALLASTNAKLRVRSLEPFTEGDGASWSRESAPRSDHINIIDIQSVDDSWSVARDFARKGLFTPRGVTTLAKRDTAVRVGADEVETAKPVRAKPSRFGPTFGETVHRAIGLVITRQIEAGEAVKRCARAIGLTDHIDEAAADVERAVNALHEARLIEDGRTIRLEYPVAVVHDGMLVSGYADLVSATPNDLVVIDFKTDMWEAGATYTEYESQVRAYADVLAAKRAALLFSMNGEFVWVDLRSAVSR